MPTTTTPDRVNLYRTPHKGLRKLLFETALTVSATDFTSAAEAAVASAAIERMASFSAEHLEHEERVVMPALLRIAPAVHRRLEEGHAEHLAAFEEIRGLGRRVNAPSAAERFAAGERLNRVLHAYIARDLEHMAMEEADAMEAFWARMTDDELLQLHGAIVSAIPPARMGEWAAYIIPAMALPERAALVGAFLAAPPPVFAQLTDPARRRLGDEEWQATLAAARAIAQQGRAAA